MNQPPSVFDYKLPLPDDRLRERQKTLLGFDARYAKVRNQLRLLLDLDGLAAWSQQHHGQKLAICDLVAEQYPLIIFFGDVGTGKSVTAECIANRLVAEARAEDSLLFKLSNRVRGSGKVGEMGTLITTAFEEVTASAGRSRRAILVLDEGDSLAAARNQEHSHHEDKVAVNTLIQCIDDLRRFGGRVVVFLCTNRLAALDAALRRRAAIIEEFRRPTEEERRQLFQMDLQGLDLDETQMSALVTATGPKGDEPGWTYSDLRTRLYPAALAKAFPDSPLTFDNLRATASDLRPSPILEDLSLIHI